MGNFVLKSFFTPFVYVQNDQRVIGDHFEVCTLGYPLTPL